MSKEKFKELIQQYFNNTIGRDDLKELLNYLDTADPKEIAPVMDELLFSLPDTARLREIEADAIYKAIRSDHRFAIDEEHSTRPLRRSIKWYYAAAVLLVSLSAGLLYINKPAKKYETQNSAAKAIKSGIILPGTKKATLTLAGGQVIDLEAQKQGALLTKGASNIQKVKSGQIVYHSGVASQQSNAQDQLSFNDLKTPKGGEYQITLPDGTRVWLNSASSLRFPSAFSGNKRQVLLSGEAYFEVAKDKAKPFIVTMGATEIKVLGTHFNISGYNDDDVTTTTLLEGSIQIKKGKQQRLLVPGQQAAISQSSDNIVISPGNVAQAMAWKNGLFRFDDKDIRGIMKQVSRWYDVEVEYNGTTSTEKLFGGTFYRSKSISELLGHLEELDSNIHFTIKGRRVSIME